MATKQLATLIKLHKLKLDQMQREMGALTDGLIKVDAAIVQHEQDIIAEQKEAARSEESAYIYGEYVKGALRKRMNLKNSKNEIEEKIGMLRDKMAEEFAEQKKFQILKRRKEEEEAKEIERKQVIAMDEISGVKHQRKQKSAPQE